MKRAPGPGRQPGPPGSVSEDGRYVANWKARAGLGSGPAGQRAGRGTEQGCVSAMRREGSLSDAGQSVQPASAARRATEPSRSGHAHRRVRPTRRAFRGQGELSFRSGDTGRRHIQVAWLCGVGTAALRMKRMTPRQSGPVSLRLLLAEPLSCLWSNPLSGHSRLDCLRTCSMESPDEAF